GVLAMANIAWPRSPDAPWYNNWIVVLSTAVVLGLGCLYLFIARPHTRSDAPAGDAVGSSAPRASVLGGVS
ncbi:MAG TPA: amino acid permease, partial [Pseudonocardia sp.]|nr:amino acid permease [Pseudonocardia sp.]